MDKILQEKLYNDIREYQSQQIEYKEEVERLEVRIIDLEEEVSDLEFEAENYDCSCDEIEELEEKVIFPREEITLPEQMKFEFLKENWDKIRLEDLEKLV